MNLPDGYQVLATLGSGAMGVVYRAHQSGLERVVALKCLRSEETPSPAFLERFRREALALSKVSHANLVKLYDVGTDDTAPYIAMELIEGWSLETLMRDQPVEVRRRSVQLFRSILDAMVTLHDAGLLHRDLKPANIMVTPDWRPVVMDLGLVKDFSGDGTALTKTGALIGTPAYLAPEVVTGSPATASSDVWALGCIYFAMNAGYAPFRAATLPELYRAVTSDPLPDLDVCCPDLPEPRRALLLKLLDRHPRKRPANARRVLDILREAVGVSRPVRKLDRSQAVRAPRRWPLVVALALTAAILAAGVALLRHLSPSAPPSDSPSATWTASAAPASPSAPPVASASAPADPELDRRLRTNLLARLGDRDVHEMGDVLREVLAAGKGGGAAPDRQRKVAERWLRTKHLLELADVAAAVPRWLADPALPEETRYRIYRAIQSISCLDAAAESTGMPPIIDADGLVSGYVKMERAGPPPRAGYRPLLALTQKPIAELLMTSYLVFFPLIPAEAGLFPESWWDHAQTVMQVLEEPDTRRAGLPWYDLGRLPRNVNTAGGLELTLRVTDLDEAFRVWIRFGKRRTVCFRNTHAHVYRGSQGVELPPKSSLESHAITLTATVPPDFVSTDDRDLDLGCDSLVLGTAYNVRYFWLVDLVVKPR